MSTWTSELKITHASPSDAEAKSLLDALDWDMLKRYSSDDIHGVDWEAVKDPRMRFLIARVDETPVACGSIIPLDTDTAELKRMYVKPEARGKGIGKYLLAELEPRAAALGFKSVRLVTGDRQPEAISLYANRGYESIPVFGEYVDDPHSLCFEKNLHPELRT